MALADDVDKLGKNQATLQKNFTVLKGKYDDLSKRVVFLERAYRGQPQEQLEEEPEEDEEESPKASARVKATAAKSKETSDSNENTGFKIFGAVGFFLILLGLFYLYTYAVTQGWISYGGRIIIGVIFSLIIIGLGELFRRKEYPRFSQLLTGGGLGLLYFTTYATYVFPAYREALGMTQGFNTILLFVVMIAAVYLSLRHDSQLLTCYAFLLGFLSALLSGSVHQTMIATLILAGGMSYIVWQKKWPLSILPVIASYLLYLIFFFQQRVWQYLGMSAVVMPAFVYLCLFFILFNALTLFLGDQKDGASNIAAAVLNAFAFLCFGLGIVWHYWEPYRGVFLVLTAIVYFGMMHIARLREQRVMYEMFFVLAISFLTIAVPVQLKHEWIAIAWSVGGFLLVRTGYNVETKSVRVMGYVMLLLSSFYVMNISSLPAGERMLSSLVTILALYATAYFLAQQKKLDDGQRAMQNVLIVAGSFLLAFMFATEISDSQGILGSATEGVRVLMLSVVWSLQGFVLAYLGLRSDSKALRYPGYLVLLGAFIYSFGWSFSLPAVYRSFARIAVILALYAVAFKISKNAEDELNVASLANVMASFMLTFLFATEIGDSSGFLAQMATGARNVLISIVWAVEAVVFIVIGFMWRSKLFRILGSILFGVTVVKILVLDLGGLETIYRIVVTMIVGIIALAASFAYVKNKDKIQKFLAGK